MRISNEEIAKGSSKHSNNSWKPSEEIVDSKVEQKEKMSSTDLRKKESLTSSEFRVLSTNKTINKTKRKTEAPEGYQNCHKIENTTLTKAYNKKSTELEKTDFLEFSYSEKNIIYSKKNKDHTKMENDLKSENYKQKSVQHKGGSIKTALEELHKNQISKNSSSIIMEEYNKSGPGYKQVIAELDKRIFNLDSEKEQIDKSRVEVYGDTKSHKNKPKKNVQKNTPSPISTTNAQKSKPSILSTNVQKKPSISNANDLSSNFMISPSKPTHSCPSISYPSSSFSSSGGNFYKGGQFIPGGGRAPKGGGYY